jgi:hypothetical protein
MEILIDTEPYAINAIEILIKTEPKPVNPMKLS